ncbi:hypothetical protein Peur_052647 [Populus x canadensis]|uniref:Pentatricopeptide repeat-containing protein n=1 Tax=Populus deltoides TaxID=3696 RepID=A0A8T2Z0Y8_POPDE|nr:hypothetical protein H0E87_008534 [Populus deltoides]
MPKCKVWSFKTLQQVPPDVSLYNAVVHGMCLRGKIESAKKLYTKLVSNMRWQDTGLDPTGVAKEFNYKKSRFCTRRRYSYPQYCN